MSDSGSRSMDIHEVRRYLPHRYPFMLIDRVLDYVPGEYLTAVKNITYNEPQFTGHFPERPIMPGVLLIEAMATVLKAHPEAQLTLAGDGPARAGAEARARELGIQHAVHFAGYMSQGQVADLLATSDLLALPSFAEGLPVVYMEALASRIPVVASRVAGVQELVEDGVTGYTVPPGDVATLADRMIRLMDDPAAARAMGEAGRRAVEAGFDIRAEGARLAEIFSNGGSGGRLRL